MIESFEPLGDTRRKTDGWSTRRIAMQPSNIVLISYFRDMIAFNRSRTRFSSNDLRACLTADVLAKICW